jgi:hypothetical protein
METSPTEGAAGERQSTCGGQVFIISACRANTVTRASATLPVVAVDCGHKPYSAMSPTEKAKLLKRQRQDKRRQALALKVLQNLGVKIFPEETPYELSNRT